METKSRKILPNKAGGNASKNSYSYKLSLPTDWLKEMKIDNEERDVTISFDGEKIIITKSKE